MIVLIVTVSILVGAALMSAAPRMRDSSRLMVVAGFLGVIVTMGVITLGFSEEKGAGGGGFKEPKGPAVASVTVDALPSIKFNATQFTTKAGINEISYVGKGGSHTLVFSDPKLAGFELQVSTGTTAKSKVDLQPGTYTVYCTIDSHRAQGMQATITVTK